MLKMFGLAKRPDDAVIPVLIPGRAAKRKANEQIRQTSQVEKDKRKSFLYVTGQYLS